MKIFVFEEPHSHSGKEGGNQQILNLPSDVPKLFCINNGQTKLKCSFGITYI